MTINFSVTQNGLPFTDYVWDEKTKTFSTDANGLVLDFANVEGVTFKTGSDCTFKTGYNCTFKTGYNCTFNAGSNCTFKTGSDCTFDTGSNCTFDTGSNCTFDTGSDCTFKTGYNSQITASENCVAIRFDVRGITEIPPNQTIKFKEHGVFGYEIVKPTHTHTIMIDGKEIELSEESFLKLKESLT